MISSWVAVLLFSYAGAALAQFYGSLGGYACSQPTLYMQCQCPSFCNSYGSAPGGYSSTYGSGYGGRYGGGYGDSLPRRHKKRRHHKKKKFRFETVEEPEEELPEPPSELEERRPSPSESSERHPPPSEPEEKSGNSKHSWENEDEWEKKFVSQKSKNKEPVFGSEELPEIDSEEISSAKGRADTSALSPAANARDRVSPAGKSGGVGVPSSVDNTGGGGPVMSGSSRLGGGGLGSSGIGGSGSPGFGSGSGSSGLGNGGLFGISSGIGVGVPGVGPIGVSSGLGIGR
ncbi:unnamed protein product [Cylicocyclus nassatus]|uniref:Uncharacterized protein n=1 Tax=Cylicocyclus nassatus TaxID=53992 RepID=A0AA36H9U8_CYLNA|nr:unnamed protein product [Cylicocyclus nassatus]